MRDDLVPGNPFPDLRLPDTTGREAALSEIARDHPLVLAFVRGWPARNAPLTYGSSRVTAASLPSSR